MWFFSITRKPVSGMQQYRMRALQRRVKPLERQEAKETISSEQFFLKDFPEQKLLW